MSHNDDSFIINPDAAKRLPFFVPDFETFRNTVFLLVSFIHICHQLCHQKILVTSFLPIVDTLLGFNLWDVNNCVNIFCHQFVVIQFRYTLDTLLYFNIYSSQNQGATDTVRRTYRPSSIKISPEL